MGRSGQSLSARKSRQRIKCAWRSPKELLVDPTRRLPQGGTATGRTTAMAGTSAAPVTPLSVPLQCVTYRNGCHSTGPARPWQLRQLTAASEKHSDVIFYTVVVARHRQTSIQYCVAAFLQ